MPNNMNIYEPITQLRAIELMKPIPSFLYDTFVGANEELSETNKGIYDYRKGAHRMAPFVTPRVGGVLMERDGYQTKDILFPTLAPERIVEIDDIERRGFNEPIYGGVTPEVRARRLMVQDLVDLRTAIALRKEWMAAQLLTTGKIDIPVYTERGAATPGDALDFGFTRFFTPATPWTDPDADIDGDMSAMTELAIDGGGAPAMILINGYTAGLVRKNEAWLKLLDIRNANFGSVEFTRQSRYVYRIGTTSEGLAIVVYAATYTDTDGSEKPFIGNGKVVCAGEEILRAIYGPVTQVEAQNQPHKTYVAKEVPLRTSSVSANATVQRLTSRPALMPENVDAWTVGDVL